MSKIKNPSSPQTRFSFGWCVVAVAFHFAATFGIAGLSFITGMGAFETPSNTGTSHSAIAFWHGVFWMWTPLATAYWDPKLMHSYALLFGLAFLWSCCVGISATFAVPVLWNAFHRWLDRPFHP